MASLAIYLDQITRPSFLPNYAAPQRRSSQPVADEKRKQVLDCLLKAGNPVTAVWIMEYTGYTKQSVMHILYKLEEEGLVVRKKFRSDKTPGASYLTWEAKGGAE